MSNRSVVVTLRAEVAGFRAALDSASQSSRSVEQDLGRMSQNGTTALGRLTTSADQHKQAWQTSGVAMLGFGAAAAAGVGLAVKMFADFDQQMAQVQTLSHATGLEMQGLTDAALNMGQNIGFTATQVADAETELIKAGVGVSDILGGALVGALDLAAAGQMDVADATSIAVSAMTQFGLKGADVPHIADLLAAGADKALGSVGDLGEALKSGGLVAHQFGMSIEDTVGTLSAFAQNGLLGEAAGTDLRQMLLKLAAPSKTATDDMKSLGMSLYDSSGHFVGITNLAGQLKDKMSGLSEAERNAMMAHIFGARSIVGANILYQQGAEGIQKWIDSVNDTGFAMQQAQGKMNNLNGDLSKLKAAWETGMIEMGSPANGFLRPVVQGITDVIHGFDALPEPVKGAILVVSALAGAGALAAGGFLTLTPKILDTINGVRQLAKDLPGVVSNLGSIGKAAGIGAAGLVAFTAVAAGINAIWQPAVAGSDETTQAILKMGNSTSSVDALFKQFSDHGMAAKIDTVGEAIHKVNSMNWAESISKGFSDASGGLMSDSLQAARKEIDNIDSSLVNLVGSGYQTKAAAGFKQMADAAQKQGTDLATTAKSFPNYIDALRAQATQAGVTLSQQDLLNWAIGKVPAAIDQATAKYGHFTDAMGATQPVSEQMQKDLAGIGLQADGTVTSMDKLIQSMEQAGLIQISANQALSNYYAALDAVDAAIQKNGTSLDIHTEKGRANQKALDDVASAGLAVVQANAKNGASQETLSANLQTTYNDLLANYKAFGITGDKADTMARQVMGIPKDVPINTAIQNYADSMLKLEGIGAKADAISAPRNLRIDVSINDNGAIANYNNLVQQTRSGQPIAFATGGTVGHAAQYFDGGGPVQYLAGGAPIGFAMVPRGSDTVPAMLTPEEFVVNRKQSIANRPILEAINNGAVYRPAPTYTAAPALAGGGGGGRQGPMTMVGTLTMDSGQVLGTFRGIARAEVNAGFDASNDDAGRRPSR